MIVRDEEGFFLDASRDGGDSCRFAGLWELFGGENSNINNYHSRGFGLRHPTQVPWNNVKNQSRDQEIIRLAGLRKRGDSESIKQCRISFWRHAKRFFFCNNFERDYSGSTKYPWPHTFINDKGVKETRLFDFADPLFPHHIFHFILCARIYILYPLAPLGWIFILPSILIPDRRKDSEINQQIAMLEVYGKFWKSLYKARNKNWILQTLHYWSERRNCPEMAELIIRGFSK